MGIFAVWRAAHAVPQAHHIIHLGGVTPLVCQSISCKQAGKIMPDGHDLAFQGLTFMPLDGATYILDMS